MSANVASLTPSNLPRPTVCAILVAALLISACATRQAILLPEIDGWSTRTEVLASREDWEFSGRIGVRVSDDGFNGSLRWAQEADSFRATVSGPLGIGTVRIEGEGDRVVLTDKDGERTELGDVENDLMYRYGWTIPVQSLRYWALGIPDPTLESVSSLNDDGQLATLEQGDWNVAITRYRDGGGQPMPNRLTATNADTRVRIVIDKWRFFD